MEFKISVDTLWYSSFSTGIFEVDNQHGNIDTLVDIIAKSETNYEELLDVLTKTIVAHFEYEENLLGDRFPEEHHEAHTIFLVEYEEWSQKFKSEDISCEIFTDIIHMKLLEHVRHFDFNLKSYLDK